ncbi:MAG: IclR family transcriptional regulator [Yaniella sp.]|uniref:IclR family transcriptional regulator n=1 Tax=Yaniella sp. TaxID=2773929 RepID=UPI003F94F44C
MSVGSSTLTKGLGLLRLLSQHPHGAPAAVFAREAGLPFSTAYRLLNTLTDAGYAEFDPTTKHYRIGLAVFEMSQKVSSARGYDGSVMPVLKTLSAATNESCLFSVRDGYETVTIHTVDGPEFRQTTDPGDRLSLHVSSMGKAILAALPEAQVQPLVSGMQFAAHTEHTIVEPERLLEQVADGRRDGYVYQREEVDLGMNAIAKAVVGPTGAVLGAIAIAAPLFRADKEQLLAHREALTEATQRLAATLPAV